eukprot:11271947-Heterocapsa_arctica.AAC.1
MKVEETCVRKPYVYTKFQNKVDIDDFINSPLTDKKMDVRSSLLYIAQTRLETTTSLKDVDVFENCAESVELSVHDVVLEGFSTRIPKVQAEIMQVYFAMDDAMSDERYIA